MMTPLAIPAQIKSDSANAGNMPRMVSPRFTQLTGSRLHPNVRRWQGRLFGCSRFELALVDPKTCYEPHGAGRDGQGDKDQHQAVGLASHSADPIVRFNSP